MKSMELLMQLVWLAMIWVNAWSKNTAAKMIVFTLGNMASVFMQLMWMNAGGK